MHKPVIASWAKVAMLAAGLLVVLAPSAVARTASELCIGRNLLPEIAKTKPALYRRIQKRAAAVPNAEAMFWKVARRGTAPSYLLGTMHTSDPRIAKLTPRIERALLSSRVVAVEIAVMSGYAMRDYMAKNRSKFLYADSKTFKSKLTAAEFAATQAAMAQANIPADLTLRLRPWFAYFLMRKRSCEALRAAKGYSVLDGIIADEARNNRIPVIGLETIGEQLSAFADLSEQTQLTFLRGRLQKENLVAAENNFETLVHMYLERKINFATPMHIELARAAGNASAPHEEFEAKIAIKRNFIMRDRSLPLLRKGRALIAVGALHLVGNSGLVSLYRKAGYSVTPVE
ncbi:MAG: TraB/GumN family protein [Hyphomicrobiaceae bacterium]|nr:TraB/GumN family protein [Hyphomicrobiaceae bacterium]